jgi:hypothetical protein
VPVPTVQNPDPAPVFPKQNHVPRVSTNQATQPQGNTVYLYINYDNPVAQNDPLLIPSFTETDVFISQTLKEKVWNFEYVDLALFLRQNFESDVGQKPCSLEVLDGKLVLQQRVKKIKVIDNINLWTDAFLNFTMVLIENHPSKATELLRYMYIIRNIAEESPSSRWLLYELQFRLRVSRNPTKSWASIDGELWLSFITTLVNSTINYTQRTSKCYCYDYNYKGSCNRLNCQYKHTCIKCSLQHPSIHC